MKLPVLLLFFLAGMSAAQAFVATFAGTDTPSSIAVFPTDEPLYGAVTDDQEKGKVNAINLYPPYFRQTYSHPFSLPHNTLRVSLKSLKTSAKVQIEATGQARDAQGKMKNVRIKSSILPIEPGKWSEYILEYKKDFEPKTEAAEFVGETVDSLVFTSTQKERGILLIHNLRYLNTSVKRPFEIGWPARHVFPAGQTVKLQLPVTAATHGEGILKIAAERSDNRAGTERKFNFQFEAGSSVKDIDIGQLPEGYYSLSMMLTCGADSFKTGTHFLVVPASRTTPWLGTQDSLLTAAELEDLRLAGYGIVRLAIVPYTNIMQTNIEENWLIARQAVELRRDKGLEVLWTQPAPFKSADFNADYIRGLVKQYNVKTDSDPWNYSSLTYRSENPERFEKEMTFFASQLKGLIRYYEFGNEYDRIIFKDAKYTRTNKEFDWWSTPEDYARDLTYFHRGVKAGDPAALTVSVGVTCGLWTPGRETFVPRFLVETKKHSPQPPFDIFGVHGYGGKDNVLRVLKDLAAVYPQSPWANTERGLAGTKLTNLRLLFEEMLQSRLKGARFYISFFNARMPYSIKPSLDSQNDSQDIGQFATRLYDGAPSWRFAMGSAFAYMTDLGSEFNELKLPGGKVYSWRGSAGYVLVLWHDTQREKTAAEVKASAPIKRYDLFGNVSDETTGTFTLTLTELPVYLVSASPLELLNAGTQEQKAIEPPLVCGPLDNPATWKAGASIALDNESQIIKGSSFWLGASDPAIFPGTVFNTANLSAKATFLRDADSLYIKIRVTDDDIVQTGADRIVVSWRDRFGKQYEQIAKAKTEKGGYDRLFSIRLKDLATKNGVAELVILVYDGDTIIEGGRIPYLIGSFGGGTEERPGSIAVSIRTQANP